MPHPVSVPETLPAATPAMAQSVNQSPTSQPDMPSAATKTIPKSAPPIAPARPSAREARDRRMATRANILPPTAPRRAAQPPTRTYAYTEPRASSDDISRTDPDEGRGLDGSIANRVAS